MLVVIYCSASARAAAFADALADAMRAPVSDGIPPEPSRRPTVTTRADVPERNTADAVAAVPAVLDTEPDTPDGDRVEHESGWPAKQYRVKPGAYTSGLAEGVRQARLRRWQAVDQRERKA